jgi:hypothetical protein
MAERFDDASVQKTVEVDLAMIATLETIRRRSHRHHLHTA